MRKQLRIILVIFCTMALMPIVQPQFSTAQSDESPVKFVGVRGDSLILIDGNTETLIEQSENPIYPLQTNSRGDVLYMMYWVAGAAVFNTDNQRLMLYDGQASHLISDAFWTQRRPYFADDDHVIFVSNVVSEPIVGENGDSYWVASIMNYDLNTDTAEEIDTFDLYMRGGGGGPIIAMDEVRLAEVFSSMFSYIPDIYNVELNDLIDSSFEAFGRPVAVSPDHSQLVFYTETIDGFTLTLMDVATETATPLLTSDQSFMSSYWGDDGFLYVASSSQMDPSYPLLTDDEKAALREAFQISWNWDQSQHAQLQRVDPESGEGTILHSADHVWAFTRITTLDGYLYWSQIPDGTEFIEMFRNGEFDGGYYTNRVPDQVLPDVYRMPLDGGNIELVAEQLQRFMLLPSGVSE